MNMNININQLTASIRDSLKTLNANNLKEDDEKAPFIQHSYVDSIELSYKAIELSTQDGAETGPKEALDTGHGQEEAPGTNQQQETVFANKVSLDFLA